MDTAVRAVMEGKGMYRELDMNMYHWRIAHKEWLAFEWTVTPILRDLKGKVLTWHVNNMNVRQAWLKSGSARDIWLCRRIISLQQTLHEQNTLVVLVYTRSAQHLHADLISRNKVLPDWHLSSVIAMEVFNVWGLPEHNRSYRQKLADFVRSLLPLANYTYNTCYWPNFSSQIQWKYFRDSKKSLSGCRWTRIRETTSFFT